MDPTGRVREQVDAVTGREWTSDVCYRLIGREFSIRTTSRACADAVERALGMLEISPGGPLPTYSVIDDAAAGTVDVSIDGASLVRGGAPAKAFELLVWHIMREAVDGARDALLVHAGVVARDGRAVLLPAASGQGKSTLVAGLVHAGFTFFSDEVAWLDPVTACVRPVRRSIMLKEGSRAVVEDLIPAIPADAEAFFDGSLPVRPHDLGAPSAGEVSAAVALLIAPWYEPGSETRLEPISRAAAVTELAAHAFNLEAFGARSIRLLASVVRNAECFRLTAGSLADAVGAISELMPRAGS